MTPVNSESFLKLALALATLLARGVAWQTEQRRENFYRESPSTSASASKLARLKLKTRRLFYYSPRYQQLPPNFRQPPHPCFIFAPDKLRPSGWAPSARIRLWWLQSVTSFWRSSPTEPGSGPQLPWLQYNKPCAYKQYKSYKSPKR